MPLTAILVGKAASELLHETQMYFRDLCTSNELGKYFNVENVYVNGVLVSGIEVTLERPRISISAGHELS
jgi:hypothetical protein